MPIRIGNEMKCLLYRMREGLGVGKGIGYCDRDSNSPTTLFKMVTKNGNPPPIKWIRLGCHQNTIFGRDLRVLVFAGLLCLGEK